MADKKKRKGRTFRLRVQNIQDEKRQGSKSMALVMAELTPGKTSIGLRGDQDTVHFFAEDLSPQEAARTVADIVQGRISVETLSERPWRTMYYPVGQEQQPPRSYKYTLPQDDQEVMVSAAAMALLDLVKRPLIQEHDKIEEHALYNCEMTHQHSKEPLTNDYESWKALFIPNYVAVYQRGADGMDLDKLRAIADRHDILTVLAEFRNIVKMIFFPDMADLSRLAMEYQGVIITPHRAALGYYVSFEHNHTVGRTSIKNTPKEALGEAEHLIERLKNDEDLPDQK